MRIVRAFSERTVIVALCLGLLVWMAAWLIDSELLHRAGTLLMGFGLGWALRTIVDPL